MQRGQALHNLVLTNPKYHLFEWEAIKRSINKKILYTEPTIAALYLPHPPQPTAPTSLVPTPMTPIAPVAPSITPLPSPPPSLRTKLKAKKGKNIAKDQEELKKAMRDSQVLEQQQAERVDDQECGARDGAQGSKVKDDPVKPASRPSSRGVNKHSIDPLL